jgi:uncharacterized protein HemX
MRTNQTGFGHVLLLVLLVAVAVVGFAAYRVWNNQETTATKTPTTAQTPSTDTLTSASQELDQLGNSLDSSLDASSLDADLDSM